MFHQSCQRAKSSLMQLLGVSSVCCNWKFYGLGWATLFRAFTIIFMMSTPTVKSNSPVGTCWLEVGSNGRCRGILELNVTWESCCSEGYPTQGWTPHTHISAGQYFLWVNLSGGAPGCRRCEASCEGVRCDVGKSCRMRSGAPKCVCEVQCHHEPHLRNSGPKCGSDGRTYNNMCSILRYNCRNNKHVDVNYSGPCKATCADVECDAQEHCVHDQQGVPQCAKCGAECAHRVRHGHQRVCGTDGQQYDTFCHLKRASCLKEGSVSMAYRGACVDGATCSTIRCRNHETCITHPVTLRPQCLSCDMACSPAMFGRLPVCGSDGHDYTNWCALRRQMCRTVSVITTAYTGPCRSQGVVFPDEVHYDSSSSAGDGA